MAGITSWAAAVCAVAVICSLFEMLAPTGSTSKMLNFVLGLFLVVAVLVPFAKLMNSDFLKNGDINFEQQEFELPHQTDNLTIAVGKSAIEKIVSQSLNEKEIPYKKIDVTMDSSNNSSIDMIVVDVYVESKYRNQLYEIQNTVKEKTGITPNVYVR